MKRIVRFTYAAIKRYGAKRFTVCKGAIEINTNYVVSVSQSELRGLYEDDHDRPFFVELSNGTKLLIYLHDYGTDALDEILSGMGEAANCYVSDEVYGKVSFSMLNPKYQ